MPISRVRSVTETSMMFMMPIAAPVQAMAHKSSGGRLQRRHAGACGQLCVSGEWEMNNNTYRALEVTAWSMKKSDAQMWGATPEGESLGLACDFRNPVDPRVRAS